MRPTEDTPLFFPHKGDTTAAQHSPLPSSGMSLPLGLDKKKEEARELPFWPNFVYREMIVWLVLSGILFSLAVFLPPSLGQEADLMAPAPEGIKPEWYFLFLFQTLKIFPSRILLVTGDTLAVSLILLAGILFFLLPFIDNRPEEKKGKAITFTAYLFIIYAVVMTIWSLVQ